ncbi:hypothetical protein JL721_9568 [Aureococcus anophagefferens]|nr:hypothetical protein JL721_9568 [Aureococcus anophagefferens]
MELFTRLRDSFSSAMSGASSGTEDAGDGAYNADRDEHPQRARGEAGRRRRRRRRRAAAAAAAAAVAAAAAAEEEKKEEEVADDEAYNEHCEHMEEHSPSDESSVMTSP